MVCNQFASEVEVLFHQISDQFASILREFYEPYGLTAPQAMILIALHRGGPEKISDMAKKLSMTNSNLSVICQRLEKSDFVIRKRDEFDQRVVYLYLSDRCKTIMQDMECRIGSEYLLALQSASEQDKETILKGLLKLNELLSRSKK